MTGKGMIMPTKAKQKKYNILMAVAIVIIAVCGIMAVGHLKGWFGSSEVKNTESALICSDTKGVVQVERSGVGYTLKTDTVMQNGDTAEPVIVLEFTAEGTEKFKSLTERYTNKIISIWLDDVMLAAPTVQAPITDGQAIVSGDFTIEEATKIANQINSGTLPYPLE